MTVINCHPQHKFLLPLLGLTLTNLKCQLTQTPLMVSLNLDNNSLTNFPPSHGYSVTVLRQITSSSIMFTT